MANNPRSAGIGTGAAQVYDYSRIDNAMRDAMGIVSQKRAVAEKRQQELDDEKRKAIQQMRGEFGDYDTTKMKRADVDYLINMVKKSKEQLDGNWDKVYQGDPYYSNLYNEHVMLQKKFIGDSIDSKEKFQAAIKAAEEPDSGFSEAAKERLLKASITENVMWSDAVGQGITTRDQIIGNIFENIDGAFLNSGDELYDIKQAGSKNAQGGFYEVDSKIWKDDKEAFPKFKSTIKANPSLIRDMDIQYSDVPEEERMQRMYEDYKSSRETYKKDVTSYAAQDDSKDGVDGATINVVPYVLPNGVKGITFANPKKALTPVSITVPKTGKSPEKVLSVMPSEIYKNKKGEWKLRGKATNKSWNELTSKEQEKYGSEDNYLQTAEPGDVVDQVIQKNMAAKIAAQYGISDYEQYFNGSSSTGGAY